LAPDGVDDVTDRLNVIVEQARRENSRVAYFAVLYRLMTEAIRAGLEAGRYEDPARLARLTSIFAGRYFDALERFRGNQTAALSWDEAFRATADWRPVVVQHLLLGVNAHINYDLGIAAVQAAPGAELQSLRRDFDAINDAFGSLIDRVEEALARIWPSLRLLDLLGGRKEEQIINFSIRHARAAAWAAAERLVLLDSDAQAAELRRIDLETRALARKILTPGIKLTLALLVVRVQERGDVSTIIDVLEQSPEVKAVLAP
jgi:Family of unknown function (DUF5995)